MHGAVEGEVELDVPLEPVDLGPVAADPALEPGRVGDVVGDRCSSARAASPSSGRRPRTPPARARSRRGRTTFGCVRLARSRGSGRARRRRSCRACCRRARPGRCRSYAVVSDRARCCGGSPRPRPARTRASASPRRGGGPGSIGSPSAARGQREAPSRGPSAGRRSAGRCPGSAGRSAPRSASSASGCQRFGSRHRRVPASDDQRER